MDTAPQPAAPGDSLDVTLLAQGEQTGQEIAAKLAAFIRGAQRSLDLAVYDLRLSDPLKAIVAGALRERAAAGVAIRIAYDADKPEPPQVAQGMDPAPPGTGQFVQSLGYPYRRIGGPKLMHNKYIVRDLPDPDAADDTPGAAVWTGSTNMTDDSWNVEENNILQIASPPMARFYAHDFADLWQAGDIGTSGSFDTSPVTLQYAGTPVAARVYFSPGRGPQIDDAVAARVSSAQRRVRIWSMLHQFRRADFRTRRSAGGGAGASQRPLRPDADGERADAVAGRAAQCLEDRRDAADRRAGGADRQDLDALPTGHDPRLHARQGARRG